MKRFPLPALAAIVGGILASQATPHAQAAPPTQARPQPHHAASWALPLAAAQPLWASSATTAQQLNLSAIHASGIQGQGVRVAVLDSGIHLGNPEFAGPSAVLATWDATTLGPGAPDLLGHGSHVAGVIAARGRAEGMAGVAPQASLLVVNIFRNGLAYARDIDRGLLYAQQQRARVVNLSIGAANPTGHTGLRRLVVPGGPLIVIAAGNDGGAHPTWPARYARESWANGTLLAVGAVDANREIAWFSNRAGDTARWYLVAPGVGIVSTQGSGYGVLSGTSAAAPAVSGAAALLFGQWPYLNAEQAAQILLQTADDLGAPGVDPVYGHGLLNVQRALAPVGHYTYRNASGQVFSVALAGRRTGTAPRVAPPSAFRGLRTLVFDAFGRHYDSAEGQQLQQSSTMTLDTLLGQPQIALDAAERMLPDGSRLTALRWQPGLGLHQAPTPVSGIRHGTQVPAGAEPVYSALSWQGPDGQAFAAGNGSLSSMALGLMGGGWSGRLAGIEPLLAQPLTHFAPAHRFAALTQPLGRGWQARAAFVGSRPQRDAASAQINIVELAHLGQRFALSLSYGAMQEHGLLGGFSGSPGLGLDQHTRTRGITASFALAPAPGWALAAAFSAAYTQAPQAVGLLEGGSGIRSNAYGLGLVRQNAWRTADRLSVMAHAPLRARSGSLVYGIVDHVQDDGTPIYARYVVDLRGAAREWLAEARYTTPIGPGLTLTAAAARRLNPDNDPAAPAQTLLGLRLNLEF